RAAPEARLTMARAHHGETLRREQLAPRRPGWCIARGLRRHFEQGPPGQRDAGCGMRDARCGWCVMEVRFEELRSRCGALIESRQPTRELTQAPSLIRHPEACKPDLPQLELRRLR